MMMLSVSAARVCSRAAPRSLRVGNCNDRWAQDSALESVSLLKDRDAGWSGDIGRVLVTDRLMDGGVKVFSCDAEPFDA